MYGRIFIVKESFLLAHNCGRHNNGVQVGKLDSRPREATDGVGAGRAANHVSRDGPRLAPSSRSTSNYNPRWHSRKIIFPRKYFIMKGSPATATEGEQNCVANKVLCEKPLRHLACLRRQWSFSLDGLLVVYYASKMKYLQKFVFNCKHFSFYLKL